MLSVQKVKVFLYIMFVNRSHFECFPWVGQAGSQGSIGIPAFSISCIGKRGGGGELVHRSALKRGRGLKDGGGDGGEDFGDL